MCVNRIALIVLLLIFFGYGVDAYAEDGVYLDLDVACSNNTPAAEKLYLSGASNDTNGRTGNICIDNRYVYKNAHITKFRLSYLKQFDSYILTVSFDALQLSGLNKFIGEHMYKRFYYINNNVVVNANGYFVFSSILTRPKLSISVNSEQDGIELWHQLRGDKPTEH
jgi:hypothetical protein